MEIFKYEISIKGMKCSSCSNKIESTIRNLPNIKTANINLITEKMIVVVDSKDTVNKIEETITDMGFKVVNIEDSDKKSNSSTRVLKLFPSNLLNPSMFLESVKKVEGVVDVSFVNNVIKVEYDKFVIDGTSLVERVRRLTDKELEYNNNFILDINEINKDKPILDVFKLLFCLIITALLIVLTMVFPKRVIDDLNRLYVFPKCSLYLVIVIALSAVIIILYGFKIYKKSIKIYIKKQIVNMETLITLGSLSAILLCFLNCFRLYINNDKIDTHSLMVAHSAEAAATVISIITLGKYIEDCAKNNIKSQMSKMFSDEKLKKGSNMKKIKPGNKTFTRILEEKDTDAGLVEKDDICLLSNGDFLLVDSVIISGEVEVGQTLSHGNLQTEIKGKGEKLKSGTEIVNIKTDKCVIMVEEVLEDSLLFKLIREMSNSLSQKLKFQHFVDNIIKYFVPLIMIISIIILIIWVIIKYTKKPDLDFSFIFERSISVLVISCPCAFGLAIPMVTTIATNMALKYGILIKNLSILPEIRKTKVFVFDKTGTLTEIVKDVNIEYRSNESTNYPVFEVLAALEKTQKHPIAEALYSFCMKTGESNLNGHVDITEVRSNGIMAKYNGDSILVGNESFMQSNSVELRMSGLINDILNRLKEKNLTKVLFTVNKKIDMILSIDTTSEIRKETHGVFEILKFKKVILSGDSEESVFELGRSLGLGKEDCIGGVDTHRKKEVLQELKSFGKVLMIGDGINDILSLSEADFGISFNANSSLNLIASDIIFIKEDLSLILSLMKLSKLTYMFIWINIFWAFAYNILMLPTAAGAFHSLNIDMTPTSSSFSMLCSSLLIIITSNLLRLFKLDTFKKDLWIRHTIINTRSTTSATDVDISDIDMNKKKKVMITKKREGYIELV
jgi:heavy metal translocating P-type ATPase